MPSSDQLQRCIPGLQKDLFTVTGVELVRKATDELTLGMHWYVLMTLVHSAGAASAGQCSEGSIVKFDPGGVNSTRARADTTVFNYEGGQYKRVPGAILEADTCAALACTLFATHTARL